MTGIPAEISEVTQTILYSPEAEAREVYGNCLQAAMASALGLDLDAVPHFGAFASWSEAVRLWLHGRGLNWRREQGIPAARSVVIGPTNRGVPQHAVVGEDCKVIWDPHPSRAGLTGVSYSYVLEERA